MGKPLKPREPLDDLRREVPSALEPELRRRGVLEKARQRLLLNNAQAREELLGQMGQAVDEAHQAELKQRLDLARVRTRLLSHPERQRSRRWVWASVIGASGAAAAVLMVVLLGGPRPLTFTVNRQTGEVGQWLSVAEADTSLEMRFSDGSNLRLEPCTSSRVNQLTSHSALVGLEQGTLDVHVVPGGDKRWELDVGPFSVKVVGTRFKVSWDQKTKHFSINMQKGKVKIRGPTLGERELVKGEAVEVWVNAGRMVFSAAGARSVARLHPAPRRVERVQQQAPWKTAEAAARSGETRGTSGPAPAADTSRPRSRAATAAVPKRSPLAPAKQAQARSRARSKRPAVPTGPRPEQPAAPDKPPGEKRVQPGRDEPPPPPPAPKAPPRPAAPKPWDLARSGRYRQAMAAANQIGWNKILTTARAEQLSALATAARTESNPRLAIKLLNTIRRRFPASASAARATFTLGTISVHQLKDHAAAAGWFTRYLERWPRGPLAVAARGRLVESLHRTGKKARACAAARSYSAAHPRGPHIRFVRMVLLQCNPGKTSTGGATR